VNQFKNLPLKYQHYLLVTLALLFTLYIVEPLWLYNQEQREQLKLKQQQFNKVESLLGNAEQFTQQLEQAEIQNNNAKKYLFSAANASELKIEVQLALKSNLKKAECEFKNLAWQDERPLDSNITQWQVELQFEGKPSCLLKFNRMIEESTPLYKVESYRYVERDWSGQPGEFVRTALSISLWQFKGEEL